MANVDRKQLSAILEKVKPGLTNKDIIEQACCFIFAGGFVATYNDEISVRHPLDDDFPIHGAVRAKEFHELLAKFVGDELTVKCTEGEIRITNGKTKAGMRLEQEVLAPVTELKLPKKWTTLPDDFVEGIRMVLPSVSKDMAKPILTCIHIEGDIMESCDNYLITQYYLDADCPDLLLPGRAAKELMPYKFTKVGTTDGWIHFKDKDNVVLSCRTYAKTRYPNLDEMMDITGPEVKMPKDLAGALERAGVFVEGDDERIEVILDKGTITVRGEGSAGWVEDSASCKYKGKPLSFAVPLTVLERVLKKGDMLTIGENALLFADDKFAHAIAKLRA